MRALAILVALCAVVPASVRAQDIWATPEQAKPNAQAKPPAAETKVVPPKPAAAAPTQAGFETVALEAQTYEARVLLGLRQIVLRDFDGAIATFRRAAQLEPNQPQAFCHLGEAELQKGDNKEAKLAFDSCARFATLQGDARYATLAVLGVARMIERSNAELKDKRDAWARARDGSGEGPARAMAEARLAMFDAALAREKDYEGVRRRIVEREVARESQGTAPAGGF
jgi:tetratricopeptide (TPR) repeat protein